MNKQLLSGGGRMLRFASAKRSIVWCQIGLCSILALASVHDRSFDTSGKEAKPEQRPCLSANNQSD
jgi:hypothetical protein